jgi:hypothetical protein
MEAGEDPRKIRLRYTGYVILHMHGKPMACPRISSDNRASVREYVRETSLDIQRRRRARGER